MLNSTLLCVCICLSFIFNGYIENIFIVLAALLFYKQIIIDKEYKYMVYAIIISFISVNFVVIFGIRHRIEVKDILPDEEETETVVLLVSEGESKNYNLKERATEIYYDKGPKSYLTGIKDLYSYKSYYNKLGSSDFKEDSQTIAKNLRVKLGSDYKVVNSYLYSTPYFENSLEYIISKGYKNIILCPLFMTEGKDYNIFKKRYEGLNLSTYNLKQLEILETFYKSDNLAKIYKDEIIKGLEMENKDIGLLLIGLENENNLEQDVLFREKVKEYILEYEKNKDIQIKLPLLENNKKDIIKAGEELLEYGIDTLYVALPTYTIDTMYTKHLVESILEELDMGNTKFHYINPEKKYEALVDEICIRISLTSKIGG